MSMEDKKDSMKNSARMNQFKGVFLLFITAFIWGSSFVSQSIGIESVEAFTFNGIRTLLGALVLLPIILIKDRQQAKHQGEEEKKKKKLADKKVMKYGLILGLVFCAATNFQQYAFYYSTSGKIAFITALYMFFVPLIGLFFRKKVSLLIWICILLGFVGLYFLCINPNHLGGVNQGDILSCICAFFFAIHILLVEKFSPEVDGMKLSCFQFIVAGILTIGLMFLFETPSIEAITCAAMPILYSGILSCGLAYTFQILGQSYTESTVASLIMCMESVFAVLVAAIVLHEMLTGREIAGCVIMFIAIVLSQLSEIFSKDTLHHKRH